MKYSQSRNYLDYMDAYAAGDLQRARTALEACLGEVQQSGSPAQQADLLQRIGGIEHELGNVADALKFFRESESADRDSLLAKYQFARFLAEKLMDHDAARRKCDEILELATVRPFAESEDDFGSEEYQRMAKALMVSLRSSQT